MGSSPVGRFSYCACQVANLFTERVKPKVKSECQEKQIRKAWKSKMKCKNKTKLSSSGFCHTDSVTRLQPWVSKENMYCQTG